MSAVEDETYAVTSDRFRTLMSVFPTGVTIVTVVGEQGEPRGFTCSSLCSVAVDPPTLLICVRATSPTLAVILDQAAFTVNLLRHDAQPIAEMFASGVRDRFDLVRWSAAAGGGPHLLDAAHAVADCRVVASYPVADHRVVIGEAVAIRQ